MEQIKERCTREALWRRVKPLSQSAGQCQLYMWEIHQKLIQFGGSYGAGVIEQKLGEE